ncbi:MAG TPA: polymer-forming cytoskeletal protein [Clostridiales bacterium]|jgi:cytoskeletal protein CcmA (bactofilin family)|nr:polymer-forming cytoskeletal protein [Clostridiales bacterium]
MGLKENFYQALRELLGGAQARPDPNQNSEKAAEIERKFASFNRDISNTYDDVFAEFDTKSYGYKSGDTYKNPVSRPVSEDFSPKQKPEQHDFSHNSRPARIGRSVPINGNHDLPAYFSRPADPGQHVPDRPAEKEMSIISKNTIVFGDIRSLADVTIDGKVRGNVDVLRDVTMHGVLVGNLRCSNTRMEGSSIQGNIMSKGNAYIHSDSVLLGNLKAQNSNIDGKVKGNINIGNRAYLHQNAIVVGDIRTNTIAVEDGANIKGFVNTAFLFEEDSAPFPSEVVIESNDININLDEFDS